MEPKTVRKATADELAKLDEVRRGPRKFKWTFPPEVFDGDVYALEVRPDQVASAVNSFRNQCHSRFNRKAQTRVLDGFVWVAMKHGVVVNAKADPGLFEPLPKSAATPKQSRG